MFLGYETKDFKDGIIPYKKEDLMDEADFYDFALDVVYKVGTEEGYEVIEFHKSKDDNLSGVFKKNDTLYFLIVEADKYPNIPVLKNKKKYHMYIDALAQNAKLLYASVSFGSKDQKRCEAGLCLRGDGYFVRFNGFEEINLNINDFKNPLYLDKILTNIGIGYMTCSTKPFLNLIDADCTWYSPWSKLFCKNGYEVKKYYIDKFKNIRTADTKISYRLISELIIEKHLKLTKLMITQTLNGETHDMLVKVQLNTKGLIKKMELEDPVMRFIKEKLALS